jgi:hypothetical protein
MTDDPEKLLKNVRRVLDEQSENLDGSTLSRLNGARQKALEGRKKRRARLWGWSLVPAAAATLMLLVLRQPSDFMQPAGDEISDLQILISEESLDFFQEDLAFYEWIEEVMEKESVHNDNNHTLDHRNDFVVSTTFFERGAEQSADRRTESGWRVFGVSRFI